MTDEQVEAVKVAIRNSDPASKKLPAYVYIRLARAAIEAYEAVKGGTNCGTNETVSEAPKWIKCDDGTYWPDDGKTD